MFSAYEIVITSKHHTITFATLHCTTLHHTCYQILADANFTIISAPSDVWYLDHADNTWDVMYSYDPTSTLTAAQESLVMGGEVAMWAEHIDEVLQSVCGCAIFVCVCLSVHYLSVCKCVCTVRV